MDIRKLQRAIVDGLEDVKAQDIVVFNTEKLSPLFERVIIASGTSNRQTKALASSVRETVKKRGLPVLATEGQDNGEWIIVDCGAAVAHIMQPAIREYYHLEEIWGGKSVKLKALEAQVKAKGLPKASEPMPERPAAKSAVKAPAKSARKAPARKPAPQATRQAAKPAAKSTARPAAKSAARQAPAKKAMGARAPAKAVKAGKAVKAAPRKAPRA